MKKVSSKPEVSLQEAEDHYQSSRRNYTIDGSESHLAYYREKHPVYYSLLLQII